MDGNETNQNITMVPQPTPEQPTVKRTRTPFFEHEFFKNASVGVNKILSICVILLFFALIGLVIAYFII